MAGCELGNHGNTFTNTSLYWVCPHCRDLVQENREIEIVERKSSFRLYVMPIAGIIFVLTIISEILAYWH